MHRVRALQEWAETDDADLKASIKRLFTPLFPGPQLRINFRQIAEPLRSDLLNPEAQPEPASFRQLLDTPGHVLELSLQTEQQLRTTLVQYAANRVDALAVTRIEVEGPFEALNKGMRVADLPGTHDVNTSRALAATDFVSRCSHVWVATKAQRAAAETNYRELLRRQLRDNRFSNAALVLTQADQMTPLGDESEGGSVIMSHASLLVFGFLGVVRNFSAQRNKRDDKLIPPPAPRC